MGVTKLFKSFVSNIDSVIINNFKEPFGFIADLNGFIHKCAQTTFGYGNDFYNKPISEDMKSYIRKSLRTKLGFEQLKLQFLALIPLMLTKLIIEIMKPTDFLILVVDGKAPIAKGKQQSLRRTTAGFERHLMNGIPTEEKFDTAYLTAGTPFMRDVSDVIEKWILANKSKLPHYVLFSGSDVEGEGEHKIFAMLEVLKIEILSKNTISTTKDLDQLFRTQPICVYGTDADLFTLCGIRDYNFKWIREPYDISKFEEGIDIDIARNYIINNMTKDFPEMTKEQRLLIFDDFTILSFLIGDDFVPAMFPLTGNIKETLDSFISTYNQNAIKGIKENTGFYYLNNSNDINIQSLTVLINLLVPIEKKLYEDRQEVDRLEREAVTTNDYNIIEKVKSLRIKNRIGMKNNCLTTRSHDGTIINETYTPSPYFNLKYEDFCEKWKEILRRPCLMSDAIPSSYRIEALLYTTKEELNNNSDDACQDYITGLRWNYAYYKGRQMGNWFYKRSLPPTIHALSVFLNSGKYKMVSIERQIGDYIISPTQMLIMVLNPNFNKPVIDSIFKTDKTYNNAIINCKFLIANFTRVIRFIFQGKYKSEEHSKIPLLPQIIIEDIFKIIPQLKLEVHKQNSIEWTLGSINNEQWSRIVNSKINIARTNEIKIFKEPPKTTRFVSPPHSSKNNEDSNKLNNYVNKGKTTLGGANKNITNDEKPIIKNTTVKKYYKKELDINTSKVGKFRIINVDKNKYSNFDRDI